MTSLSAVPSNQDVFTIGPSTLVVDGLRISLLSLEDGKERIADVASGLAKAITAGFLGKEDVTVNLMQEKLYCMFGHLLAFRTWPDLLYIFSWFGSFALSGA